MCTTAAIRLDQRWMLLKTRDPVSWMRWDDELALIHTAADSCRKLIVQNPDSHQDGYYGGINEHGVALVATYVHVAENQIPYLRKPYVRLILEAKTAQEAVRIIQSFAPRIGGNIFVADTRQCFGIEAVPEEYFVEEITGRAVKTNHFTHLHKRNLSFDREPKFEAWSKQHQQRAVELLAKAKTIEDLQQLLRDRKHCEHNQAICTTQAEDPCCTHSAMIFDCGTAALRPTAYYAQGNPLEKGFIARQV